MTKIAIMGYGVVGSGVAEVFYKNRDSIIKKAGTDLDVKYILDIRDFPGSPFEDKFTKDFNQILNDPEVGIVAEVMGGLNPAFDYVKRCLEAGKSVVTSNKELVAAKGAELFKTALAGGVNFLFEASVGGGIPVIRPMAQCLAANEIDEIVGILNGTTNFILTKMISESMPFEDALALAQQLGYAERDPSADIDGHDACRKICILASLAFGKHVYPAQIHTVGIRKISLSDVAYAKAWGGVIKLIARAKRNPEGMLEISVSPELVSRESQLSTVEDVFNAILIRGDATGDVMFYGRGAGKLPTASAVVADIIDCAKHMHKRKLIYWEDGDGSNILPYADYAARYYVRGKTADAGAAATLAGERLGKLRILHLPEAPAQELAFITPKIPWGELTSALRSLASSFEAVSILPVGDC